MRAILSLTVFCCLIAVVAVTGQTGEASKAVAHPSVTVKAKPKRVTCKSAEKAIVYYRAKVWYYQEKLGNAKSPTYYPERRKAACGYKRFVVSSWRGQAREYRKEYATFLYHHAWWKWLPSKWQRIARCETGYQGGTGPGESRWDWNSGTYQGAFGFYWGTWDQYKPSGAPSEAYLATPRQQYQAALNVYADHGYGAWGCGGA